MNRDIRSDWIAKVVPGKSFLEVGGLWGAVNETVSLAHQAGASELCMVDIWQPESEWWVKFRERCRTNGVGPVREVVASIDNPSIAEQVGKYDVIYCSGVLYHCPNPFLTVRNLMSLARDVLLLSTVVMPPAIENECGRIEFGSEAAICLPFIGERSKKIIDKYSDSYYGGSINIPMDFWYFNDGSPNYGPWWWLWTPEYVEKLLITCGLKVESSVFLYGGKTKLYRCELEPTHTQDNYFGF